MCIAVKSVMDQVLVAAQAAPGWLEHLHGGEWDSMKLLACYCELLLVQGKHLVNSCVSGEACGCLPTEATEELTLTNAAVQGNRLFQIWGSGRWECVFFSVL